MSALSFRLQRRFFSQSHSSKKIIPSVMCEEVKSIISRSFPDGGLLIDASFGDGGHSLHLTKSNRRHKIIGIDCDHYITQRLSSYLTQKYRFSNNQFTFIHSKWSSMLNSILMCDINRFDKHTQKQLLRNENSTGADNGSGHANEHANEITMDEQTILQSFDPILLHKSFFNENFHQLREVVCIDAKKYTKKRKKFQEICDSNQHLLHGAFDAVLLDIGTAQSHENTQMRGFSYQKRDMKMDMRLDTTAKMKHHQTSLNVIEFLKHPALNADMLFKILQLHTSHLQHKKYYNGDILKSVADKIIDEVQIHGHPIETMDDMANLMGDIVMTAAADAADAAANETADADADADAGTDTADSQPQPKQKQTRKKKTILEKTQYLHPQLLFLPRYRHQFLYNEKHPLIQTLNAFNYFINNSLIEFAMVLRSCEQLLKRKGLAIIIMYNDLERCVLQEFLASRLDVTFKVNTTFQAPQQQQQHSNGSKVSSSSLPFMTPQTHEMQANIKAKSATMIVLQRTKTAALDAEPWLFHNNCQQHLLAEEEHFLHYVNLRTTTVERLLHNYINTTTVDTNTSVEL